MNTKGVRTAECSNCRATVFTTEKTCPHCGAYNPMNEQNTSADTGEGLHLWYVGEGDGEWRDIAHVAVARSGDEALGVVRGWVDCEGGLSVDGHVPDGFVWAVCYPDDEPEGDLPDGATTMRDPAGRLVVHATAGAWAAYYGRAVYLGSSEDV